MKRNWEVIREVLIEVEALSFGERDNFGYELSHGALSENTSKDEHALLLWEAGFISGIDVSTMDGPGFIAPKLTWEGHELLETIRSQAVWERIKTTAKSKGIELTLDSVKILGKSALAWVLAN
ncbi:DUF2513 domain-containing protein [Pseudomonas orientalis]|uniref:DUF2513 domain-containing protein n=1 Tax=Pseudomonas orientalis TaxID=76758 RepID=A0A4V2DYC5_9PSED|nr:DUF2513 domain-containing protein [Pseudomonas orientalis]RZI33580.1 DUF2513 domain-containing protein [Pseudomonas orientalis]